MQYKDTLELYDELMAGGSTEIAARAQAKQLGATGHAFERIDSKFDKIDSKFDLIFSELKWIMRIGGFISVTLITIGIQIYLK